MGNNVTNSNPFNSKPFNYQIKELAPTTPKPLASAQAAYAIGAGLFDFNTANKGSGSLWG